MAYHDLIAVDIGNSFAKLQVSPLAGLATADAAPHRVPTAVLAAGESHDEHLAWWLGSRPFTGSARWVVATVHAQAERVLEQWVRQHRPGDGYSRLVSSDLPLEIDVAFPDRVGIDRLLNALAAQQLCSGESPAVVIDAGSAITVDAVSADGRFQGGAILPGLRMATAALSRATDQLPLAAAHLDDRPEVIGKSTEEAIRSGVLWGTLGAVRELSQRMAAELGRNTRVFVTGGDAACLRELAGERTEFHPHLVLRGIRLLESHLQTELSRS